MGTLSIDYPDAMAADLIAALAWHYGVDVPSGGAAKVALAQEVIKHDIKVIVIKYKKFLAAQTAEQNQSDPAVTW